MANPSLNNGYFQIANEIADVLARTSISGSEIRIFWVVCRKTWGWVDKKIPNRRKDFDKISYTQFSELTGMKHVNVVRSVQSLVAKRLLLKNEQGYGINQDYDEWVVVKRLPPNIKKGSSQNEISSSQTTTVGSSQLTTKSSSQLTIYKRKERKIKKIQKKVDDISEENIITPKERTKEFFKGVQDMQMRIDDKEYPDTIEMEKLKKFLNGLMNKYPGVDKKTLWAEIVNFSNYWNEKNQTGKKTRWELQTTYMIEQRLGTWFRNNKKFTQVNKTYQVEKF